MNAIEFAKKHGIEYTTGIVVGCESGFLPKNDNYFDLKQIVDAWGLVFEHGSIERAKKYADSAYTAPEIKAVLVRAINLVEQCQ